MTVDEFKGRRPIVRGSDLTVEISPGQFRNPLATASVWGATSARKPRHWHPCAHRSRVEPRERAANTCSVLPACGGAAWDKAVWGAPAIGSVSATLRVRPARLPGGSPDRSPRLGSPRALPLWERALAGAGISGLAVAPSAARRARPAGPPAEAEWRDGARPRRFIGRARAASFWAFLTSAIRLVRGARAEGLDLAGAQLTVTGEIKPVDDPPARAPRRRRRRGRPRLRERGLGRLHRINMAAPAPAGRTMRTCSRRPERVPDPARRAAGTASRADALLHRRSRATAPFMLLNVSGGRSSKRPLDTGDAAAARFDALGWRPHLHRDPELREADGRRHDLLPRRGRRARAGGSLAAPVRRGPHRLPAGGGRGSRRPGPRLTPWCIRSLAPWSRRGSSTPSSPGDRPTAAPARSGSWLPECGRKGHFAF